MQLGFFVASISPGSVYIKCLWQKAKGIFLEISSPGARPQSYRGFEYPPFGISNHGLKQVRGNPVPTRGRVPGAFRSTSLKLWRILVWVYSRMLAGELDPVHDHVQRQLQVAYLAVVLSLLSPCKQPGGQ
jgi:hypothetical protein